MDESDIQRKLEKAQDKIRENQVLLDDLLKKVQDSERFERRAIITFILIIPIVIVATLILEALYV